MLSLSTVRLITRLTINEQVDIKSTELAPGKNITLVVKPKDGKPFNIQLTHTFNAGQIEWFKNGSALNTMAKNHAK